jgi:hypothetical protein
LRGPRSRLAPSIHQDLLGRNPRRWIDRPCRANAHWPRTGPKMVAERVNARIREPECRQAPEGRQRRPARVVCRPPHRLCRPIRGLKSSWGRLSSGYRPRLPSVTTPGSKAPPPNKGAGIFSANLGLSIQTRSVVGERRAAIGTATHHPTLRAVFHPDAELRACRARQCVWQCSSGSRIIGAKFVNSCRISARESFALMG